MANTPPPAPPPMDMSGADNKKTPYDFFLNEQAKQKKGLNLGGGSFKSRLLIVAGGGLVLIILIIVLASVLSSGNKGVSQQLLAVAQEQTEIVRVADIGVQKARSSTTKNLATTVKYSVSSSLNDVIAAIKVKNTDKTLRLKKNSSTDQTLESAATNNNFDDVFKQTIDDSLKTYQTDLKKAYDASSNQKTKQALSDAYNSVSALLTAPTN